MIDVLYSDASSPIQKLHELQVIIKIMSWWAHQDSNLEPRDYESPALTVEL